MAKTRKDVGSRSCDGDNNAGGGARGRRLALARVKAMMTLAEARADVGSTCSRDGDDDAGGGARGRRLSLVRVKATTTLAEVRADVGSRSRDGDDDAGGGARGRRLSLAWRQQRRRRRCARTLALTCACMKATTMAAVACVDVISHLLDSEDRYCGGVRGHRLLLARVNNGSGGAHGHQLSLHDGENDCALAASLALSREDDGDADNGTQRRCTTTRTTAELTRHCCWPALPHAIGKNDSGRVDYDVLAALSASSRSLVGWRQGRPSIRWLSLI